MLARSRREESFPRVDRLIIDEDFHRFFVGGFEGKPSVVRLSDLLADRGKLARRKDDDQEGVDLDVDQILGRACGPLSTFNPTDGLQRSAFSTLTVADAEAMAKYERRAQKKLPDLDELRKVPYGSRRDPQRPIGCSRATTASCGVWPLSGDAWPHS